MKKLDRQKIVVFAVGSAANDSFSVPIIKKHNLSKQELERIDFFYFRGGYNKDMLTFPSKAIMSIVSSLVFKRIQNKKPELKEILEMMKNGADYTEAEDIFPLVTNVKS
jgi:hypothetical protein